MFNRSKMFKRLIMGSTLSFANTPFVLFFSYMPCPFSTLSFATLHNFPFFVALKFCLFTIPPELCSIIHLLELAG